MAEVTATGFVAKTEQEYYDEERQLYLDIDPDWNLDPSSPDGLKLAADSETFTNIDEALQAAYNSKDPNKARDLELDIICALTGTERDQGTPSTITLNFTGVDGTIIPAGEQYESTVDGTRWATDSSVTITSGVASVPATCTVTGSTNADIGTITRIINTIGGLQTVTNPVVATQGRDKESNAELRLKRAQSVGRQGNNQINSMIGEILAVEGVKQAIVFENATDETDANGLPKRSIAPLVDGGSDEAVALAVYIKKNPGVRLFGVGDEVELTVIDPDYPTQSALIRFGRPIAVPITVSTTIKDDGTLPANIVDLIKSAIIEYAEGDLIPTDAGFNSTGFGIGENVPISRINTPINQVIGRYGNSYVSSLTLNGQSTGEIDIDFNELSQWLITNITVTII